MSKVKLIQTNWTSGELSPLMMGRVDTNRYQNGAATLTNFIVRQQGPIWRRSGSKFIAEVKFSAKKTILQDFEFSDVQAYSLEFGEGYVRVFFDGGFVETFPGSGVPLEVVTPYLEADLPLLKFTQSADILYITHPLYQTRQLERLGANNWTMVLYASLDGPYLSNPVTANLTVTNVVDNSTAVALTAVFGITPTYVITAITASGGGAFGYGGTIVVTVVAHPFITGDSVTIQGVGISRGGAVPNPTTYPNGNGTYVITKLTANTFSLNGSVYIGQGTPVQYSITSAKCKALIAASYFQYREDNVWKLAYTVFVADTTHATVGILGAVKYDVNHSVVLAVSGTTMTADHSGVFTLDDVGKYVRQPQTNTWYRIIGFTSDSVVTIQARSVISYTYPDNIITVTEGTRTASVTSDTAIFALSDVGRHIRFNFDGKQPWGIIIAYIDSKHVTIDLRADIPRDPTNIDMYSNSGSTQIWRFGAWSDTTGWPKTVAFHEQRLVFGGSNTEPTTLWMSQSSDYTNMAPTAYDSIVTDNCAVTYTIVSTKANPILWLQSGPSLLVGTLGGEWQVKAASSINQPITPTNINITPQTNHGSKNGAKPHRIGASTIFIQRAGRKLIELTYNFQLDSFVGKNLTVVSEHILRQGGSAVQTAYQQEPNNIYWICLSDGTLVGMTYEIDQQVVAFHKHALGGNGFIESIACVPSTAGTEDLLYMVVRRTINGATKRYIEYLTPDFYPVNTLDKSTMFFLDCGQTYAGAPINNPGGLGYLEGEIVTALADGKVVAGLKVNGGHVTLPFAASVINVGYGFSSIMQILPLDGGTQTGTAQGKVKRTGKVALRMYNSLGVKFGPNLNKLDVMKPPAEIFTGDQIVSMPVDYSLTGQFYVVQDQPYPLTLLMLAPDTEVTT